MFYCESCRAKKSWPESFEKYYGPCELCGKKKSCHSYPASALPDDDEECEEAIKEEGMSEWKKVGESWPDDDEHVLAYFEAGGLSGFAVAFHNEGGWHEIRGDGSIEPDADPTHWMPLPKEPL